MMRPIAVCAALAAAATSSAGCAENGDEVLLILQNQFPSEGCEISGEEDSLVQDDGTLDLIGRSGYVFTPLVKNTAPGETGTEAQRRVFIKGARVDIRFADVTLFSEAELQQYQDAGLTRFDVEGAVGTSAVSQRGHGAFGDCLELHALVADLD